MVKSDFWFHHHIEQTGLDRELINPNSVDLKLGGHIVETRGFAHKPTGDWQIANVPIHDYKIYYKTDNNLLKGEEFTFLPDRFYLCHSFEYIKVPEDKCAMLFLKSSMGRKGLEHSHAGWIDSGFEGQLTWEITTHLPCTHIIGEPMCQIVYMDTQQVTRAYSKTGRYQGQTGATEARIDIPHD